MEESVTYQAILREGQDKGATLEARKILLRQGELLWGKPSRAVREQIEGIAALTDLEALLDRVHEADSWQGLLANLKQPRRRPKS